MWALLRYVNAYDQYGGYFSGVFTTKEEAIKSVDHIGREGYEHSWYELKEIELGVIYPLEDY